VSAHELVGATLRDLVRAAVDTIAARARGEPVEDEAEAIHDLRVALRRLRSALRPVRGLYGKRTGDRAEEMLKAALDLTSELRDEEVLRETLASLALSSAVRAKLDTWMLGRARREKGLRGRTVAALATAIADPEGLTAAMSRLESRIERGPREDLPRDAFVHDVIEEAVETLEERARSTPISDVDGMHRVRISGKKLRYTAALLGGKIDASIAEAPPRAKHLAAIEKSGARVQKRLGQLHDVDLAIARMHRAWGLDRPARLEVLAALQKERARLATVSERELRAELERIRGARQALEKIAKAASENVQVGAGVSFGDGVSVGKGASLGDVAPARENEERG
jgi:CHAD domain-containing protein